MKKIITLLIITIIGVLPMMAKSPKNIMETKVSQIVSPRAFTDFRVYETITLADEVVEQLNALKCYISWHKAWYQTYTESAEDETYPQEYRKRCQKLARYYKNEIAKDERMISILNNIKIKYPEFYNEVSFTTYRMNYMYMDENGNRHIEICFGKFNDEGDMVAFKPTGTSNWEILGDLVSIPGFDINYCKL